MIETAEVVADRYGVSRDAQDAYALQSQQRTADAQAAGRFDAEIVPLPVKSAVVDKETGETRMVDRVLDRDECNRPDTTI
ncbi:acetyl-CoA C-acyltransferase, partial [Acinetobacter baumannii]